MASKFLNLSTDTTLGGNAPSDEIVASQKALKTYIDNNSGGDIDCGELTVSTKTFTAIITGDRGYGEITVNGVLHHTSEFTAVGNTNVLELSIPQGTTVTWEFSSTYSGVKSAMFYPSTSKTGSVVLNDDYSVTIGIEIE